jgi:hypothetical protein
LSVNFDLGRACPLNKSGPVQEVTHPLSSVNCQATERVGSVTIAAEENREDSELWDRCEHGVDEQTTALKAARSSGCETCAVS